MSVRRGLCLALLCLLVVGPARGLGEAVLHDYRADLTGVSPQAEAHLRWVRGHLGAPFHGYGQVQVLASSFQVVALSNLACGLLNVAVAAPARRAELTPSIEEVARRALSSEASPYHAPFERVGALDDHNLYLSHLALVLGAYRFITGDARHERAHERIVRHLAARTAADGDFHARSYPGSAKWPADQTATLAAIALYDLTHGTTLAPPLVEGWLEHMRRHATDRATGLFRSSISELPSARTPRGCALSWSTYYLAQIAPEAAAAQYAAYRRHMTRELLGLGGFREWPPDRARGMDVDSGPIVLGVGMAATGFGLGAARVLGDAPQYATIARTAAVFGVPIGIGARSSLLAPLLGEAILFNGETAVRWRNDDAPPRVDDRAPPTSTAAVLLLLAWAIAVALLARASLRRRAPPPLRTAR